MTKEEEGEEEEEYANLIVDGMKKSKRTNNPVLAFPICCYLGFVFVNNRNMNESSWSCTSLNN